MNRVCADTCRDSLVGLAGSRAVCRQLLSVYLSVLTVLLFATAAGPALAAADLSRLISGGSEPPPAAAAGAPVAASVQAVYDQLLRDGYSAIEITVNGSTLAVRLAHSRISDRNRALGRAVRIINAHAPGAIKNLVVCYQSLGMLCGSCYAINRAKADSYFKRMLSRWQLENSIVHDDCAQLWPATPLWQPQAAAVVPPVPAADAPLRSGADVADESGASGADTQPEAAAAALTAPISLLPAMAAEPADSPDAVAAEPAAITAAAAVTTLTVAPVAVAPAAEPSPVSAPGSAAAPILSDDDGFTDLDSDLFSGITLHHSNRAAVVFNPIDIERQTMNRNDGGFYADLSSSIELRWLLTDNLSFKTRAFVRWTAPDDPEFSLSELPRVRTDIDFYRDENRFNVDQFYLGYIRDLDAFGYLYTSAGYLEEMFSGLAAQLYKPDILTNTSVDLKVDWLHQRDFADPYKHTDYEVVSALMGVYWRAPGVPLVNVAELQAGQFLAEDVGFKVSAGYEYDNGVVISLWHSDTRSDSLVSGHSTDFSTSGIALKIPLGSLREKDTQRQYVFDYASDFGDSGQMLHRPEDLADESSWGEIGGSLRNFGQ
jgi:hypothetical protein